MLFFDIETAPLLAYVWQPDDRYVTHDRLLKGSFMLTWGAKWPKSKVYSGVLTSEEAKAQDDRRIVTELADMIRQADAVVAHNGNRFDLPMLNNRLLALRLEPLGPVRSIDTLRLAKSNFRLEYNKLDYLGEFLGLGRKIKTDQTLWNRAYVGDETALAQMKRYNAQDVRLLQKVYEAMIPYLRNLPRMYDAMREGEKACPFCGSEELTVRGYQRTQASTFQRYQCRKCLRYSRARTVERLKKIGLHPL